MKAPVIRPIAVRFLGLFVVAALGSGWLAAWASADEKAELKGVQKEIKSLDNKLQRSKSKRDAKQASLEEIEKDIANREQRQRQLLADQAALSAEIEKNEQARARQSQQLASLNSELQDWLRLRYRLDQQNPIKLVLSEQDPARLARINQYFSYLAKAQSKRMAAAQAAQAALAAVEADLSRDGLRQTKLAEQLNADQQYLAQLKRNREATIAKLDASIRSDTEKTATLRAREKRLRAVLARIAKQSRARQSARKTNKSKAALPRPARGTGSLPMPVKAPLLTRFGQKRSGSDVGWTGVMLGAQAGVSVRAIQSGEVVYADWLKGYGQLMIVDHGNGLLSLYGHNAALLKRQGERVAQREVIAHVGDTAGLRKPALYFEIRYQGEPQDPLKWCKA